MTDGSFHCYNSSSEVDASNIFLCILVGFDVIYAIKLSIAVTLDGVYNGGITSSVSQQSHVIIL